MGGHRSDHVSAAERDDDLMERRVRRTRLRAGAELHYEQLHSRIPEAQAQRLRAAGVARWEIWRDGLSLIHVIDYRESREATMALLAKTEADPVWDAAISELLDLDPNTNVALSPVWYLDHVSQGAC